MNVIVALFILCYFKLVRLGLKVVISLSSANYNDYLTI